MNDEQLIEFIRNIKEYDNKYDEIFFEILQFSSDEIYTFLLNHIVKNKLFGFIKIKDSSYDWDPIHAVCEFRDEKTVLQFLDIYERLGLDFEIKNKYNWVPIHFICKHQKDMCVMRILDIYEKLNLNLEILDNNGYPPIIYICKFQNETCVMRILDIYEKLNLKLDSTISYKDGKTLVDYVREFQNEGCMKRILEICEKK